jgi:hypothetical protein
MARSTARRTGRERDSHYLAALAHHGEGAVASLQAEGLDVGTDGL